MAFQSDPLPLTLLRFISAIGVGANVVAIDAYLAETLPRSMRGRGFAISKAIQYAAVPIAGLLAALLSHHSPFGLAGWRYLLIVPALGALLVLWLRRTLPESPRWLAAHGREDEALAIVIRLEEGCRRRGLVLPEPVPTRVGPEFHGKYSELLRSPLIGRLLMIAVVSCSGSIAYFGFSNWLPSLLIARHVEITKTLIYSSLVYLCYPLAPLLFSLFADRIERKWQIVIGSLVTMIFGLAFSVQTTALGWLVTGLLVSIGTNLTSYATHTYRAELFPTALRGRAIGMVYSVDRLASSLTGYLIGFILVEGGVTAVLVAVAGFSVATMTVVTLFGPRTRADALSAQQPSRARAQ